MSNNYRLWTVRYWDFPNGNGINQVFGNSLSWKGKARTEKEAIRKAKKEVQRKKLNLFGGAFHVHSAYPQYAEKELFEWMFAQPAETPVDMGNGGLSKTCVPCLLGAFFRAHGYTEGYVEVEGKLTKNHQEIGRVNLLYSIFRYFDSETYGEDRGDFGDLQRRYIADPIKRKDT